MKVLIVLIVLVIAGVYAAYHFGGLGSFDPNAKADELQQNVQPGMTWQQVMDVVEPKKVATINYDTDGFDPVGPSKKFDLDEFKARLQSQGYPDGFVWQYTFSAERAYDLTFGPDGKLASMDEPIMTKDLLDGTAHKKY